LIDAVRRIVDQGVELICSIIGEGSERTSLEAKVRSLGLHSRVKFLGHIGSSQRLHREYRNADIFVLPSLSEGFPRVIYEAMSQSLPVVCTKVGGIPETLSSDQALLVRPGCSRELSAAVVRIATQSKLRRALINKGYEWTLEIVKSQPRECYARILQQHLQCEPKPTRG
jgi:glycosyltransferase involved in cell wall biosynthesis